MLAIVTHILVMVCLADKWRNLCCQISGILVKSFDWWGDGHCWWNGCSRWWQPRRYESIAEVAVLAVPGGSWCRVLVQNATGRDLSDKTTRPGCDELIKLSNTGTWLLWRGRITQGETVKNEKRKKKRKRKKRKEWKLNKHKAKAKA